MFKVFFISYRPVYKKYILFESFFLQYDDGIVQNEMENGSTINNSFCRVNDLSGGNCELPAVSSSQFNTLKKTDLNVRNCNASFTLIYYLITFLMHTAQASSSSTC